LSGSVRRVWSQWNRDVPFGVSLALVIGFFLSLMWHRKLTRWPVPVLAAVVGWIVPVLAIQRVVPFDRVWLFLFPLFAMQGAAGVTGLLKMPVAKPSRQSAVIAIISVAPSFWLALRLLSSQSVYYSAATGTLRDAEAITIFLKSYLQAGDRVLASVPSDAPLVYYFNLHGIPLEHFKTGLDSANRVLIVVNKAERQELESFLEMKHSARADFSAARVIRYYESATLYRMDRMM
jgi:hypothetical protein